MIISYQSWTQATEWKTLLTRIKNFPFPCSAILQLPPPVINSQIKTLCDYLVAVVCKFEEPSCAGQQLPPHVPSPTVVGCAILPL